MDERVKRFINRKYLKKYGINESHITENVEKQIKNLLDCQDKKMTYNRLTMIITLIKNDVEENWVERLVASKDLGNDSSSLKSYLIRYGETGKKLFEEKIRTSAPTKEKYLTNHTEKEWSDLCDKKSVWGEKKFIERFGETNGKKKWKKSLKNWKEKNDIHFRNGFYGKTAHTIFKYQEKYGLEEGKKRWDLYQNRISYSQSEQGFIDKFGDKEGKRKYKKFCKSKDHTSEKAFIIKYGDEIGLNRYKEFIKRVSYCQTEDYFKEKYDEDLGSERYKEYVLKKSLHRNNFKSTSKCSQKFFWKLYELLPENVKSECQFYELVGEYKIYANLSRYKVFSLDFKYKNKNIEYDGVYWHKSRIEQDNDRDNYLRSIGFDILRITDIEDEEIAIEKCLKFLIGENKDKAT